MSNLLRSLLLTTLLSFATAMVFLVAILGMLSILGYCPGLAFLTHLSIEYICDILRIFGSGYPLQGMLVIGFTFSAVGGLFDLYNFYLFCDVKQ